MKESAAALLLILLSSLSVATVIQLPVQEEKDFGISYHKNFDSLVVYMDCEKSKLDIYVKDGGAPVEGAMVRLLYVDYATPLLSSGLTDKDGKFSYTLVGNKSYMRGMFSAVVEKGGYKNKEAHFDIIRCLTPQSPPSPPQPQQQNQTPQESTEKEEQRAEQQVQPIPENMTNNSGSNVSNGTNITEETEGEGKTRLPCCFSFFILMAALFGSVKLERKRKYLIR